jgi:hypothetical protein
MKRIAFALGVLALGFAANTPAHADTFAVVRFELGFCRIYWNPAWKPWGPGWSVVATAPDFASAWAAQTAAVQKGKCR